VAKPPILGVVIMHMKWRVITCLLFILILGLVLPIKALAHGAKIEYTVNMAIEIVAAYDNGEPMAGAQVTVYAPDDPSSPWLAGVCDDEGHFSFIPDTSKPGTWDVQVRQAGHGDIVHIPIGKDMVVTGGTGGYTALQIVLMAVCFIWGSVGTALYFSRRRRA
jgi:nickel transport protein